MLAASMNGVNHCNDPFNTDTEAALYHEKLATHLHGLLDEPNYLDEAMCTPGGVTGGFNIFGYDSSVSVYIKPSMQHSFQFGIHDQFCAVKR